MRLLFVADGRSPTAAGWIGHFIDTGHEVHLVSTHPAEPWPGLQSFAEIPGAAGRIAGPAGGAGGASGWLRRVTSPRLRTAIRRPLEARSIRRRAARLRAQLQTVRPDLVHALRIPFEGVLAAEALRSTPDLAMRKMPLVISVWGNDFTLHAGAGPRMAALTKKTLLRADAVIADTQRDIRLAHSWGFPPERPTDILPGGGGVRTAIFFPPAEPPSGPPRIIQPRGLRAYVQNEAFLNAIPTILGQYPEARFICPGLAGNEALETLAARLGIAHAIELLPPLPQADLARHFRRAAIILSPTTHDGTPNTLLEALACGCFPVAGDLESIREWIVQGENGLLVNPESPASIAAGLLSAIHDPALRRRARDHNIQMALERAGHENVMPRAEALYRGLL